MNLSPGRRRWMPLVLTLALMATRGLPVFDNEIELALRALEDDVSKRSGGDTAFVLDRFVAATEASPAFDLWLNSFLEEKWRRGVPRSLFESYWQANRDSRPLDIPGSLGGRPIKVVTSLRESSLPERSGVYSISRVGFNERGDSALVSVNFACRGLCGSETLWLYVRQGQRWERRRGLHHMVH